MPQQSQQPSDTEQKAKAFGKVKGPVPNPCTHQSDCCLSRLAHTAPSYVVQATGGGQISGGWGDRCPALCFKAISTCPMLQSDLYLPYGSKRSLPALCFKAISTSQLVHAVPHQCVQAAGAGQARRPWG